MAMLGNYATIVKMAQNHYKCTLLPSKSAINPSN